MTKKDEEIFALQQEVLRLRMEVEALRYVIANIPAVSAVSLPFHAPLPHYEIWN